MTSSNGTIFRVTGPLYGEFTSPDEIPAQGPVTRSFDVLFDLRLNKRLSKQPWGWWFEMPSWSLWRQYNLTAALYILINILTYIPTQMMCIFAHREYHNHTQVYIVYRATTNCGRHSRLSLTMRKMKTIHHFESTYHYTHNALQRNVEASNGWPTAKFREILNKTLCEVLAICILAI